VFKVLDCTCNFPQIDDYIKSKVRGPIEVISFPITVFYFATNPWAFQNIQTIKIFDHFCATLKKLTNVSE
jgi:hypothetical protein